MNKSEIRIVVSKSGALAKLQLICELWFVCKLVWLANVLQCEMANRRRRKVRGGKNLNISGREV